MFLQLSPHSNHLGVLLKQKLPEQKLRMMFIIFIYKNESVQQHFQMNYCLYYKATYPFTD